MFERRDKPKLASNCLHPAVEFTDRFDRNVCLEQLAGFLGRHATNL